MTMDPRALRELLGAYVLDQLDTDRLATVRAHLAGCAECRAEGASLQPIAAVLHDFAPPRPTTSRPSTRPPSW